MSPLFLTLGLAAVGITACAAACTVVAQSGPSTSSSTATPTQAPGTGAGTGAGADAAADSGLSPYRQRVTANLRAFCMRNSPERCAVLPPACPGSYGAYESVALPRGAYLEYTGIGVSIAGADAGAGDTPGANLRCAWQVTRGRAADGSIRPGQCAALSFAQATCSSSGPFDNGAEGSSGLRITVNDGKLVVAENDVSVVCEGYLERVTALVTLKTDTFVYGTDRGTVVGIHDADTTQATCSRLPEAVHVLQAQKKLHCALQR
jgi:hypothetical protein